MVLNFPACTPTPNTGKLCMAPPNPGLHFSNPRSAARLRAAMSGTVQESGMTSVVTVCIPSRETPCGHIPWKTPLAPSSNTKLKQARPHDSSRFPKGLAFWSLRTWLWVEEPFIHAENNVASCSPSKRGKALSGRDNHPLPLRLASGSADFATAVFLS